LIVATRPGVALLTLSKERELASPTISEGAQQRNIVVEAYSPLGTGRHLSNKTVQGIAAAIGRTPAQVLLRWCLQRDLVVISKSTHRERIAENAQIFDFTLSDQDMAALDALDRTNGTDRPLERTWW
jgi:2,5-diketo-D-gluconate reductase A